MFKELAALDASETPRQTATKALLATIGSKVWPRGSPRKGDFHRGALVGKIGPKLADNRRRKLRLDFGLISVRTKNI